MRGTSGPTDVNGKYNFYCRSCGKVMLKKDISSICEWCGSILIDQGFGISGDNSVSETSVTSYASRGEVIVDVDKEIH